ncbi:MAG: hypothetical protein A3J55_01065 [Candidatus Ryanbacteria bacterium RIFCSPHIGHO2_02_FULL_45_17b]|uniref:Uncharacterized protein n=1 Tax=Candidatus Ryanbacteria bacterium RIFCSPHIGHO2_01_FULL_45_22 TaxID=1802114 RepID=A0A1G2G0Y8_9BACT|nr:MAG: hypothetical protein A2719_03535 [Candidatus Ryanbacteria bacterium RIFCSPHIGHO2_01_FULL_45_22]OGZ47127.1 MAG: hypothetical protein A3J55_01065 [Candidatus Ryanbacteria bacterium RIFCSPHIGHO2_02_FULL_45_17b]
MIKQNAPTRADGALTLWHHCLGNLADLNRVRSFRTVGDFKGHPITFAKLIKGYTFELVRVEKEIFFLTLTFDEPETLVGETGNCSFFHKSEVRKVDKISSKIR